MEPNHFRALMTCMCHGYESSNSPVTTLNHLYNVLAFYMKAHFYLQIICKKCEISWLCPAFLRETGDGAGQP